MQAPTPCVATNNTTNTPNNKTMRQYKESEWREEYEELNREGRCSTEMEIFCNAMSISRATTRGAVLHSYFSLPPENQLDRHYILDARKRLKAIRKKRKKRVIDKIRQWRKSITTRIYRWQLQCEYKRIMRHDQTK